MSQYIAYSPQVQQQSNHITPNEFSTATNIMCRETGARFTSPFPTSYPCQPPGPLSPLSQCTVYPSPQMSGGKEYRLIMDLQEELQKANYKLLLANEQIRTLQDAGREKELLITRLRHGAGYSAEEDWKGRFQELQQRLDREINSYEDEIHRKDSVASRDADHR